MLNLSEYIKIIFKNVLYLILFIILSIAASYFYINQNLKTKTDAKDIYSDVIISPNHISPHFIEELNLILLEINAINHISNMLVDYQALIKDFDEENHRYQIIDISSFTKRYNIQIIIANLLDSLMNKEMFTEQYLEIIDDADKIKIKTMIESLTVIPRFGSNGDILEILISYNGENSEFFFNNLIKVVEYSVSKKLYDNIISKVSKIEEIKDYYKEVNINLKKIKETELFEQTKKINIVSSKAIKDEISMKKLLSEIDLKVIDNKLKLISDDSLEKKLIQQINELFKSETKILKKYSILFQTFQFKEPSYFFVYVVFVTISIFVFIIFILFKEVIRFNNN